MAGESYHAESTAYVLVLDVGTSTIRAHVYDNKTVIRGMGSRKIQLMYPRPGFVEMDEMLIWQQAQDVVKDAISNAGLSASDITCMGITTQRNTFITWDRETGEPFHHLITWQDLRASGYVKQWNDSYTMKLLRAGSTLLYLLTRYNKFLVASMLRFKSAQVLLRLKWQIDHDRKLQQRIAERQVMFGCLDTWLLWQLTGRKVFATDYSCASSTMLFDPFQMEWNSIVLSLVGLPLHIFPPLMDTSGVFGKCDVQLFGAAIPITAMVGDQQGAMFGQCCFNVGDVKCTVGTGTFINTNTGNSVHASVAGLYPLVGWKFKDELVFIAEGFASDTGRCLEWVSSIGLYEKVSDAEHMAASVSDSAGVFFVPAFNGLQMPINDDKATSLVIGLSLETKKEHIVRAVLESLAFRFALLYETVLKETKTHLSSLIKVDGGVSNNGFLMQLISNLTSRTLDRPEHVDMTSLGAAFLAGLAVGVWKNKEELMCLRQTDRKFEADMSHSAAAKSVYKEWLRAVDRSRDWRRIPSSS